MQSTRFVRRAGTALLAGVAAVVLLGGPPRAAADGERPAPLEVRLFDVGGLTMGRSGFDAERGPLLLDPDRVDDAEGASFGAGDEEAVLVLGSIEDVIELVKHRTKRPTAWFEEGTSIDADGPRWIVVRGPTSLQEDVAATLAALERETMGTVTVDVLLLDGDPAAAAGAGGVAGAVERGALRVVGGVRTAGQEAHRVSAFLGRERTYVVDHDVEVAQDARLSDPVVGMQPEGLAVRVYVDGTGAELALDLRAWTADVPEIRAAETARHESVEMPDVDVETVATLLRVKPGTWAAVPLGRTRSLAVRATLRDPPAGPAPAALPSLRDGAGGGDAETVSIPVSELGSTIPNAHAPRIGLWPSHYTFPAPPELAQPLPPLSLERLAEVLRWVVDPASWEQEGRALEVRNARFHVRHDAAHVAAVRAVVNAARPQAVGMLRFRATVVRLPLSSFPEWIAGLDDGAELLKDGGASLLARPGAKAIDRIAVRTMKRGRNAAYSGRARRFVTDYDVEIAEKAMIGNPIVGTVLVGTSLDVEAGVVGNGAGITCEVRLDRSTWEGSRQVPTAHGAIECPDLGLLRVRAGTTIPVGGTRLLGMGVAGGEATLVLLSAGTD